MIKKTLMAAGIIAIITLAVPSVSYAAPMGGMNGGMMGGMMNGGMGQMGMGQMGSNVTLATTPGTIVSGTTTNSAAGLTADTANATTIVMSDSNSEVKIDTAGTYIISGTCSDGNITVKKGTTGVVLILKDLDLTSTTGATVSCNKNTEVKIVIEGTVKLTDAEDPVDEDSTDADVADAFDGAAIKVKAGSSAVITGTGKLNIDASSCKNGVKVSDEDGASLVVYGGLTVNITAANDAFNSGYDLALLSGTYNISAGDDAIHADRILTIGEDGNGPTIKITKCEEGLEGTVVNVFGGNITVNANDDAVNAANSDGTYSDSLDFSINITGGTLSISAGADGLDSNGNINITGGSTTIVKSAANGGDAGVDYDGTCYIADGTLTNNNGFAGPDGVPGQEMNGMGQIGQNREVPGGTPLEQSVPEQEVTSVTAVFGGQSETDSREDNAVVVRPVYRLFNTQNGDHILTVGDAEKEVLEQAGWTFEGVAFTVPEKSDTPVYRLFDQKTGEHFFTASESTKAEKLSNGFVYEGIAWYAGDESSQPVYRLVKKGAMTTSVLYTASTTEKEILEGAGWIAEATGFCVK